MPEQIVLAEAVTFTVGVLVVFTVMVNAFELDVEEVAHATLLVSKHETTSLLANVVLVNVGLFVPAFEPFTFH